MRCTAIPRVSDLIGVLLLVVNGLQTVTLNVRVRMRFKASRASPFTRTMNAINMGVCLAVFLGATMGVAEARADDASAPVVVLTSATAIDSLAADDNVGVVYGAGQHLWRAPISRSATPTDLVATSGKNAVGSVVLDRGEAFFIDGGEVRRVPARGGASKIVARGRHFASIALSTDRVFWSGTNGIASAPRAGGPATPLCRSAGPTVRLVVSAQTIAWFELHDDGATTYMQLHTVPVRGGAPTAGNGGFNFEQTLLGDATALYWSQTQGIGDGVSIVKLGPSPRADMDPKLLADRLGEVSQQSLAAQDDAGLYVSTWDSSSSAGTITRILKAGGAPQVVARLTAEPSALAVTDTQIVWAEPVKPSGTRVLALQKPLPAGQ